MGKKTISYYNSERYPDPTACFALRNILQEEREEKRRKKKSSNENQTTKPEIRHPNLVRAC